MIKLIYRLFAAKIHDIMVEEFLASIPSKVKDPAMQVMLDHRRKLEDLIRFQAYQLHRRMINDGRNSERYQGMLIQLRLLLALIDVRPSEQKEPDAKVEIENTNRYQEALDGVNKFLEKMKK